VRAPVGSDGAGASERPAQGQRDRGLLSAVVSGLVVVGDSIAKGTGATTETVGYPHLLAARLAVGDEQVMISGPIWAGTFREQLARVRAAAETVAGERGLPFIAADWWLREDPDGLLAPDGHPNDKGHADLAARFEAAIRALRPDLAARRARRSE
jgi:lysophospholipase L1-like esterase